MSGANASPPSPDGSADYANAPWEDSSRVDIFAQAGPLAVELGIPLNHLSAAIAGWDEDGLVAGKLWALLEPHDRWLSNDGGEWSEVLSYDGIRLDDNEEEIEPEMVVWATIGSLMLTGDSDLTTDSVLGFRVKRERSEA